MGDENNIYQIRSYIYLFAANARPKIGMTTKIAKCLATARAHTHRHTHPSSSAARRRKETENNILTSTIHTPHLHYVCYYYIWNLKQFCCFFLFAVAHALL